MEVDIRKIVVGGVGGEELTFFLRPYCGEAWMESFDRAMRETGRDGPRPRIARSGDGSQYVVTWPDGPQDIEEALDALDYWMEAAVRDVAGA